jgi:hypothetical protein
VIEDNAINLQQTYNQSQTIFTLFNAGARYDGPVDIRAEFLTNTYGYQRSDFQSVVASTLAQGLSPRNLNLNGIELPGQYYAYASLRLPNTGYQKKGTLGLRYLHSLMDQSGLFTGSAEQAVSDSISVFGEVSVARGDDNTEFTTLESFSYLFGAHISL